MIPLNTWTALDTIREQILSDELGAIMDLSGVLACILAGVAILGATREYIRGDTLDAWDILKPVVLMLLTCSFSQLVLGPVNGITNIITGRLAEITDINTADYITQWSDNMNAMTANSVFLSELDYQEELAEIAGDDSMVSRFFSKVWLSIKKMFKMIFGVKSMTFAGVVGAVLFLLVRVLMFIQQILCAVYLIIISLLGPLILALSILPGFEGGFRNWLARYIQIAMWVPTGYILLAVNIWIVKGCGNLAVMKEIGLGVEWLMICLQISALVGVAAVPKIAAWIIESSGANDAHGSMSNPARLIARKLLKI